MVHGVAPAASLHEPDGRPPGGVDAPERLELREATVVGRHHDVAGQHQLDAQRVGHPVYRRDDRFGTAPAQSCRIHLVLGSTPVPGPHPLLKLGEVQASGEVVSVTEQNPAPQVVVIIEPGVRLTQHGSHPGGEAVHLRRPVDPHEQDPTPNLGCDAAFDVLAHLTDRRT